MRLWQASWQVQERRLMYCSLSCYWNRVKMSDEVVSHISCSGWSGRAWARCLFGLNLNQDYKAAVEVTPLAITHTLHNDWKYFELYHGTFRSFLPTFWFDIYTCVQSKLCHGDEALLDYWRIPSGVGLHFKGMKPTSWGDRAFSISAPSLWDSLPKIIRDCTELSLFKSLIKTHLFKTAFNVWLCAPYDLICFYRLFFM